GGIERRADGGAGLARVRGATTRQGQGFRRRDRAVRAQRLSARRAVRQGGPRGTGRGLEETAHSANAWKSKERAAAASSASLGLRRGALRSPALRCRPPRRARRRRAKGLRRVLAVCASPATTVSGYCPN